MTQDKDDPLSLRRPATQRRAVILLQSVREAARQILEQDGPSGLTTNRVAERAGVSVGSVYHYYPNKDSIIADLFDELVDALAEEIAVKGQRNQYEGMSLPAALEAFVGMMFDHRSRLAGLHREFLERWGYRFEVTARLAPDGRTFAQVTHDSLVELLSEHRDVVAASDPDAAAYGISLLAEGFGRACWEERLPSVPLEQLTRDVANAMLGYCGYCPNPSVRAQSSDSQAAPEPEKTWQPQWRDFEATDPDRRARPED